MTTAAVRVRKNRPICLVIAQDADRLLRAMVDGRGMGMLVSELIRREAERRTALPQMLEALRVAREAAAAGEP